MATTSERVTSPLLASWLKKLKTSEHKEAVTALCKMFEPLASSLAAKCVQPILGAEVEELQQVARLGLIEACESYDVEKGTFHTHAMWQIRDALTQYLSKLGNPVRLPTCLFGVKHPARYLSKMRRLRTKLSHEMGREPKVEELAAAMKMPAEAIEAMLVYDQGALPTDNLREWYGRDDINHRQWKPNEMIMKAFAAHTPEEILIAAEELQALRRKP